MKRSFYIAFCFLLIAVVGCRSNDKPPQPAFYYWKTNFSLAEPLRGYLDSLGVKKMYVKFFDVDWDESFQGPVPMAEVLMDTTAIRDMEIIPCVFITNRTIVSLSDKEVNGLATKIIQKIEDYQQTIPGWSPTEIQIDCDWTAGTRERYFALLRCLKQQLEPRSVLLSATVRLHQYKYPQKTGVPPVDHGMLMCYNTGELENWVEENSILRSSVLQRYLSRAKSYPLPLDIALPVFRWGVLFRDGRMIRLLHGLGAEDLLKDSRFHRLAEHRFEVQTSTFLDGHYLYRGDQLRMEEMKKEELAESCRLLRKLGNESNTLDWFHLDTLTVRQFPTATLQSLWQN